MDSLLFIITIILSYYDLLEHRLPNCLVLGLLSLAVMRDPVRALAAFPALLVMGSLYLLSRGSLGLGDVKLYAALSAYLGVAKMLPLFGLSFLLAGVISLVLILKNGTTKQVIPFGPFLCLAALLIQ